MLQVFLHCYAADVRSIRSYHWHSSLYIIVFDKIDTTVVSAYENVNMCSNNLKLIRKSINEEFQKKYQQPQCMVDKLDAVLAIPRTAARQIYRNNVPVTTPKNYY